MSRWQRIALNPWDICRSVGIPADMAGVYVIFASGGVAYVGSSSNLRKRLAMHARSGLDGKFAAMNRSVFVKYRMSKRRGEHAMAELRLIHRLQPSWNTQHRSVRAGTA